MNRTTLFIFFCCLFGAHVATAADVTFLTPDGQPASGTRFYRTLVQGAIGMYMDMDMDMMDMDMDTDDMGTDDMGMDDMGMDDMGMDDMMMDDMMMGSGGDAEMYGMDMGYGSISPGASRSPPHIAFLDGKPLQPVKPPWQTWTAGDDGTIELVNGMLRRNRRVSSHTAPALAVHESGFSFIPAGTKLSPKVKLRSVGKLIVDAPSGIDSSRYQVLTCWQNGFAYPSLQEYKQELNSSQTLGKQLDVDDWRFSPRFRWYQTAALGEVISVPPGEVRVAIVPRHSIELEQSKVNRNRLFRILTSGGPSTIVLVSGKSPKPITVDFPPLRSLILRAPEKRDDALPEWGDQPSPHYHLESFRRQSFGDTPTLTTPPASAVTSRSTMAKFLNEHRDERAAYQHVRLPSSTDGRNIRFDLLRPGRYVVIKPIEGDMEIRGISINNWESDAGVTTAVLADGKVKGVEGVFELAVSDQGVATFRSNGSSASLADNAASTQRSDAEKLKLVQTLRRDIEATVARLVKHRKQLLELEAKLQQKAPPVDPKADPFGGPDGMNDPFGGGGVNASDDPFGGDGGTPGDDPFGGSRGGGDPFRGGSDAPNKPPFGSPSSPAEADPFG
ncbi:hypothetical protein Enr13x_61390 [Stieleria neptunia]|uniref:Uncharacterized protein n=1 Tax=Stieleria neptunia TaxID=2527979 RepID=A0A518HZF8_9BACT|nr:hypothetical protein [Stieleria neptunia]QDV46230.1 hypothetical protein Enr13x_61390 [Stieleria neptunia]